MGDLPELMGFRPPIHMQEVALTKGDSVFDGSELTNR